MRVARPALLVLGLVGAGLVLRRFGLDDAIGHAGEQGPLVFMALAAVACTVGVPRQAVAYAGGFAFGFWPGAILALTAEAVGCIVNFYWARLVARRWAAAILARSGQKGGRIARLERFLVANAFTATLTLRLLPVGNNLALNLLAGVSGVAPIPFLAASVLGYVPQTAVFALLGGGVRVSQGVQIALAAVLMAASIALGLYLLKRSNAGRLQSEVARASSDRSGQPLDDDARLAEKREPEPIHLIGLGSSGVSSSDPHGASAPAGSAVRPPP